MMHELADRGAAEALAWLGTYLAHSTLLLALAWLITRGRRTTIGTREWIWRAAVIGGLVTLAGVLLVGRAQRAGA